MHTYMYVCTHENHRYFITSIKFLFFLCRHSEMAPMIYFGHFIKLSVQ